jgi:peptidoglycan-associated lipoprotein
MNMRSARWFVVALMAVSVAVSGCRTKPTDGVPADGMSGDVLGIRPGLAINEGEIGGMSHLSGSEVRGQFQPVYFAYDSSTVADAERAKIEEVASFLRSNGTRAIVVEGHCDERGSNEYNLALGERRALAVRAYLVGLGIGAERIQTKSFGEEQPVAMGHNEESWRLNRRSEFVIIVR